MEATVYELKLKILELLGEDPVGPSYPADSPLAGSETSAAYLLSAIHAALNALCVRVWKPSVVTIENDAVDIERPLDCIEIEAIYDSKLKEIISRSEMRVGESLVAGHSNAWHEYPYGTVTFSNAFESGGKLFYSAHWALPLDDTDELEPPAIALTYLALYAASYCLLRLTKQQAELRQFGTKVDSGNPIMLPYKEVSEFFMKRAEIELATLPATPKGITI